MHSNCNQEPIKKKDMTAKSARRFFHKNEVKLAKMRLLGQTPPSSILKRIKEATRVLLKD